MAQSILLIREYNMLAQARISVKHYEGKPGYEKLLESSRRSVAHSERIIDILERAITTVMPEPAALSYNDFASNLQTQLKKI